MDRPASPSGKDRRRFLGGLGAAGAALLTLVGARAAASPARAASGAAGDAAPTRDGGPGAGSGPGAGGGYRETAHVRRVYATARDRDRAGRK